MSIAPNTLHWLEPITTGRFQRPCGLWGLFYIYYGSGEEAIAFEFQRPCGLWGLFYATAGPSGARAPMVFQRPCGLWGLFYRRLSKTMPQSSRYTKP